MCFRNTQEAGGTGPPRATKELLGRETLLVGKPDSHAAGTGSFWKAGVAVGTAGSRTHLSHSIHHRQVPQAHRPEQVEDLGDVGVR